jgi:Lipocalin-like domain
VRLQPREEYNEPAQHSQFFYGRGVGLALCSSNAVGQSAKDLVGTWTIVSAEAFGPNPKGLLIFQPDGRYSLMLMRADLPKYVSNNRAQGTPEEYKTIGAGSISYFGTYSVSGSDLILRVEHSSFPNWTGTEQRRTNLTLTGDELKYTNTAPSVGGPPAVLVWRRAK